MVTSPTVRLCRTTPPEVFSLGDQFHVSRFETQRVTAQVIDLKTFRDRPVNKHPRNSMRSFLRPTPLSFNSDLSILSPPRSCPDKTIVDLFYMVEKSAKYRKSHGLTLPQSAAPLCNAGPGREAGEERLCDVGGLTAGHDQRRRQPGRGDDHADGGQWLHDFYFLFHHVTADSTGLGTFG